MIEMRLRHLYNTTSERQDVRQEYDIFIRYSLLILLINALIIKTHPNKVGMTHSFFFLKEIKKNVVIQAFHSRAGGEGLQLHREGAISLPWSFYPMLCVHGKSPKIVTDRY